MSSPVLSTGIIADILTECHHIRTMTQNMQGVSQTGQGEAAFSHALGVADRGVGLISYHTLTSLGELRQE